MAQPSLSGCVCPLSHKGLSTPATSHPIFVRVCVCVCVSDFIPGGGTSCLCVCLCVWKRERERERERGRREERCRINWCVSAPCGRQRGKWGDRRSIYPSVCLYVCFDRLSYLRSKLRNSTGDGADAVASTCVCVCVCVCVCMCVCLSACEGF